MGRPKCSIYYKINTQIESIVTSSLPGIGQYIHKSRDGLQVYDARFSFMGAGSKFRYQCGISEL